MGEPQASKPGAPSAQKISASLLQRAKASDPQALVTIFRQFIPEEEKLYWTEYLGKHGWLFARHSLGCLTGRRVAAIRIGSFGEVIYQDGYLECVNSSVLYQPSKLALYFWLIMAALLDVVLLVAAVQQLEALGLGPFLVAFLALLLCAVVGVVSVSVVVRFYYSVRKCGLVLWVKDGISVYVFSDRKRIRQANLMHRMVTEMRDDRIARLGHIG